MKSYYVQVRDRVTGQGKHASDLFDNFLDAVTWAKEEYGPPDFEPKSYWVLETVEIVKNSCPFYKDGKQCSGDVVFRNGSSFGTCKKCGKEIPLIVEM